MIRNAPKKRKTKKILLTLGVILLAAALVIFTLEKTGKTHFFSSRDTNKDDSKAQTTSKVPSAQSTFSKGTERSTITADKPEGTVTDNKGSVSSTPPQSEWTTSPGGAITVYAPAKNTLLKSGDTVGGSAMGDKVYYRLNDNVSGMIATGSVSVINGKFSGTFAFNTSATQGQLDIFSQAPDGTESNNVAIPVRFQ